MRCAAERAGPGGTCRPPAEIPPSDGKNAGMVACVSSETDEAAEYYLIYNVQTGSYDGAAAAGENEFYFPAYRPDANLLYVFH